MELVCHDRATQYPICQHYMVKSINLNLNSEHLCEHLYSVYYLIGSYRLEFHQTGHKMLSKLGLNFFGAMYTMHNAYNYCYKLVHLIHYTNEFECITTSRDIWPLSKALPS